MDGGREPQDQDGEPGGQVLLARDLDEQTDGAVGGRERRPVL